ncbi:nuclear transport factor 2 family protein [Shewanella sp. 10N.286.52.B9]|uniref:nuclear transport factor 2 family protein n=1 Tax=Shewanella sp. 10N.286.52.B9 TaxID=1880837 RepID=UPI000C83F2B0|nr:nuclear transport factor 2 family protein [Shewanella sp. 10N.286.52.B9]
MPSTANTVSHLTEPASNNDLARPQIIDDFIGMYQQLNKDSLHLLNQVYSDEIIFQDPLHKVEGIENLSLYFANLYANVDHIEFDIKEVSCSHQQAAVFWAMHYRHSKLNNGQLITVEGMSQLKFSDKITAHRDYFDLGSMLYEQLPLVGRLIKFIKNKASA